MTIYFTLNVKLSNSQLNELKSELKTIFNSLIITVSLIQKLLNRYALQTI